MRDLYSMECERHRDRITAYLDRLTQAGSPANPTSVMVLCALAGMSNRWIGPTGFILARSLDGSAALLCPERDVEGIDPGWRRWVDWPEFEEGVDRLADVVGYTLGEEVADFLRARVPDAGFSAPHPCRRREAVESADCYKPVTVEECAAQEYEEEGVTS